MTIQRAIVFPASPTRWRFVTADGRDEGEFVSASQAGRAAERAGYSPLVYQSIATGKEAVKRMLAGEQVR